MFHPNDRFELPAESTKIWRYMDFTKFVALLDSRSLYFSSLAKLDDPFEGTLPAASLQVAKQQYKDFYKGLRGEKELGGESVEHVKHMKSINRLTRPLIYVNCWHMNDHESAAMWRLYIKSNEGIAIQSTVKRLCDSFAVTRENVFVGKVRYVDYTRESHDVRNPLQPAFLKRISFEHELELRAMVRQSSTLVKGRRTVKPGVNIDVSLDTLVEKIYVAPICPAWIKALVEAVMKKYELEKEPITSGLDSRPVH
jgi:hypothetical protein